MKRLTLESISLARNGDEQVLEGMVEGKTLYFRTSAAIQLSSTADPFLAAMLVPAMQRGVDIEIPAGFSVSKRLLSATDELQSILGFWYPELRRISIHASNVCDEESSNDDKRSACLFSGGLDACHTLLKHRDELTHLIYIRGVDLQLDNEEVYAEVKKCNQEIADHLGKELVFIESNIRFFMRDLEAPPCSWYINQAGGLGGVCLALDFDRILIASSNPYDALHPLGTHPLTDPLWSTEKTQIVHTGCEMRRHEKLEVVAEHDFMMKRIRVCWHDAAFNCGVCDKCVHYRVALTILGLKNANLPLLDSYRNLYGAHVNTDGEYAEWRDNLLLAHKHGDPEAAKAVTRLLNRYKLKKALKLLDDVVTGGKTRSLKSRLRLRSRQ